MLSKPTLPACRIVVTGAAGHLGTCACNVLRQYPGVEIRALDRAACSGTTQVDLLDPPKGWAHHFAGADTVLHLAGASSLDINEATAKREIDGMTMNVLNVASQYNLSRIIYASSCEVLAGAAPGLTKLDGTTPAAPLNPYARAKVRMETAGRQWAARDGRSFLSLRIGMTLRAGHPTPDMHLSLWKQRLWLALRDWDQAVVRACADRTPGYQCVSLTSNNTGMTWGLDHAHDTIGFWPTEGCMPRSHRYRQAAQLTRRMRHSLVPVRAATGSTSGNRP